ncbi:GPW/gp25 family protein [Paenibacillus hamazuiensis]|uniref:GPW/gp25 family protein n=1 Tax=Paenibacillus hamazuiensis TaxID=2936508 RepID=UPI00200FAD82|nr:GPW/gp25 family protein [Paenibacillus hamazuiensis]
MNKDFLGRGWKFPVQVDGATGRIRMAEHEDDIAEAIRIILRTSPGERVMRADFGCGVQRYVFGTTDRTTLHLIETAIHEAILAWEPRVTNVEVQANPDPEMPQRLLVTIRYTVRSTNNLFNLVYPFYLQEGTK